MGLATQSWALARGVSTLIVQIVTRRYVIFAIFFPSLMKRGGKGNQSYHSAGKTIFPFFAYLNLYLQFQFPT